MPSLGLGKTLFNSSVCYFENKDNLEIILTERVTRKKASGSWPTQALEVFNKKYDLSSALIYENRDVEDPVKIEDLLNSQFPFYDHLKANNLTQFSRHFNKNIVFATHHLSHAYAAAFMSPYDKALIMVIDGAGSRANAFNTDHPEYSLVKQNAKSDFSAEERTMYTFDNGQIKCVDKKLQNFNPSLKHPPHHFSEGLGSFYEKISELVFNSKRSAGKVMGLAALGDFKNISNGTEYLENLDWSKQYTGKTKSQWEQSPNFKMYCDVSADVQNYFEQDYIGYIKQIKQMYPQYNNLIITGGCALKYTSNMKLYNLNLFDSIYIPPFPGDESIGLGTAYMAHMSQKNNEWSKNNFETQHGYFGPLSSIPNEKEITDLFKGFEITKPDSITDYTAKVLAEGHIVAWYQGRSESGPRALGNRSILARPDKKGVKDYLNAHIKFREAFRPYGCSALYEKAPEYFQVPQGFNNPYMSFATMVKPQYKDLLHEVSHVDGTSRMQTVRIGQNKLFYELIESFGRLTDLYCVLNTSLNIMGEPIVENLVDAKNFLTTVPVYGLAVGPYFIRKV